jgi:hypothetical protein
MMSKKLNTTTCTGEKLFRIRFSIFEALGALLSICGCPWAFTVSLIVLHTGRFQTQLLYSPFILGEIISKKIEETSNSGGFIPDVASLHLFYPLQPYVVISLWPVRLPSETLA